MADLLHLSRRRRWIICPKGEYAQAVRSLPPLREERFSEGLFAAPLSRFSDGFDLSY
jgi:hypothetical protein